MYIKQVLNARSEFTKLANTKNRRLTMWDFIFKTQAYQSSIKLEMELIGIEEELDRVVAFYWNNSPELQNELNQILSTSKIKVS